MIRLALLIAIFAIAQLSPHATLAQSSEPPEPQKIPLDVSKENNTHATITGSALNAPFRILFDTGSWTTSIPESAVNPAKRTVVSAEGVVVKDGWNNECRLVTGQLAIDGTDGGKKKTYTVENFEFYEILDKKKDGTKQSGKVIMGAFPSLHSVSEKPSFAYALAKNYSTPDKFGFGFVSEQPPLVEGKALEVGEGWKQLNLYLLLGAGSQKTEGLHWRENIPNAHKDKKDKNGVQFMEFCPEMVPGFTIRVNFPNSEPHLETSAVQATIDTGAPDLTLRMAKEDPHLNPPYADYFTSKGPPWWKGGRYETQAKSLEKATVTVQFEGSDGKKDAYTFKASGTSGSPDTLYAGKWDGEVPWADTTATPKNRINLGNTIYYYCPVVFYDISQKKVGFRFQYSLPLLAGRELVADKQYFSSNRDFYLRFDVTEGGKNNNLVVRRTAGDGYVWGLQSVTASYRESQVVKMQFDGNFAVYGANNKYIWSALSKNPDSSGYLTLTDRGVLQLVSGKTKGILWKSSAD